MLQNTQHLQWGKPWENNHKKTTNRKRPKQYKTTEIDTNTRNNVMTRQLWTNKILQWRKNCYRNNNPKRKQLQRFKETKTLGKIQPIQNYIQTTKTENPKKQEYIKMMTTVHNYKQTPAKTPNATTRRQTTIFSVSVANHRGTQRDFINDMSDWGSWWRQFSVGWTGSAGSRTYQH